MNLGAIVASKARGLVIQEIRIYGVRLGEDFVGEKRVLLEEKRERKRCVVFVVGAGDVGETFEGVDVFVLNDLCSVAIVAKALTRGRGRIRILVFSVV